jgi:hypothetical protein
MTEKTMSGKTRRPCPTCQGKKVIDGICEVSSEWRGSSNEDALDDSQCTPDQECPTCKGKGYEES